MPRIITLTDAKGYATEANLDKALARTGLDQWEMAAQIIKARKADGTWTAIFQIDHRQGGYVGFASQHGFMTI